MRCRFAVATLLGLGLGCVVDGQDSSHDSHDSHEEDGDRFEAAAVYDMEEGIYSFIVTPAGVNFTEENLAFMIVPADSADADGLAGAEEDLIAEAGAFYICRIVLRSTASTGPIERRKPRAFAHVVGLGCTAGCAHPMSFLSVVWLLSCCSFSGMPMCDTGACSLSPSGEISRFPGSYGAKPNTTGAASWDTWDALGRFFETLTLVFHRVAHLPRVFVHVSVCCGNDFTTVGVFPHKTGVRAPL